MTETLWVTEPVRFESQGEMCAGRLYLPTCPGPHPLVLMAHGFAGTLEARLPAYAERFSQAGIAAMIFDYRHFGASAGLPRQWLDIDKQLQDWSAALDFVATQPALDRQRLALWGTSFSGGHVLTLAAQRADIKAVIAQVPFVDGRAQLGHPLQAARLAWAGLLDSGRALLGRSPRMIAVVGQPGALAALTSADAEPGYRRLAQGVDWRNEVAARIVLHLPRYRPICRVSAIQAPVLYLVAENDRVTPAKAAYAAAKKTPRAQVMTVPGGHFDPYVAPLFESVIQAQVNFLRTQLLS